MFDRYVAYYASFSPDSVAFATPDGEVSYAGFDADIDRVAAGFAAAFPCGPDALAAVRVSNPYAHWLTLLALARLGVASMGAAPERTGSVLITDQPGVDGAFHLSHGWLAATLGSARPTVRRANPPRNGTARLFLSSGTTGTRKAVAVSWHAIDHWTKTTTMGGVGRVARPMIMVGTDTIFGFTAATRTWFGGGTVVFGPGLADLPAALPVLRPATLCLATGQLVALLDRLPTDFTPMPDLRVIAGGSPVSAALARRSRARLGGDLCVIYGSTEAGGVCTGLSDKLEATPDAIGPCYPDLEVEVLAPPGADGEIRIRGPGVATEYLDDPAASAAVFRDGWFHPGDIGRFLPDGTLCVAGRLDEVMNLGGVKLLPHRIEDAARLCPGVADVAAFALPHAAGGQQAHVAVVRGAGFDQEALVRAMVALLPGTLAPVLVWVDAIPRNTMAKVDRHALAASVGAAAQSAKALAG